MKLLKYTADLTAQLNNAPIYKYYNYLLNGEKVWIQCFKGELKSYTYSIDGSQDIFGVPPVLIIKEFDNNTYAIYRYYGNVNITRKIENNIVCDTINNLLEIEKNIL